MIHLRKRLLASTAASLVLGLALAACGQGDSSQTSTEGGAAQPIRDTPRPPHVALPPGSAPKQLVVRDIREGSGPGLPASGEVRIRTNFVALSYRTGKPIDVRWAPKGAFNIGFAPGRELEGWEKGLVGMKAGGRRELRVPSGMAYGNGAILYVIDLLGIEWPPFG